MRFAVRAHVADIQVRNVRAIEPDRAFARFEQA